MQKLAAQRRFISLQLGLDPYSKSTYMDLQYSKPTALKKQQNQLQKGQTLTGKNANFQNQISQ